MRLYIIRHGKAERESDTGLDKDRELTERGERQAVWLGEEIASERRKEPIGPALIIASRYARACATARAIQESLSCDLRLERGLEVDHDPGEAMDLIRRHAAALAGARGGLLIVVGHNPQLEALVAAMAKESPRAMPPLRTGEAVVFEAGGPPLTGIEFVTRLRLDEDD